MLKSKSPKDAAVRAQAFWPAVGPLTPGSHPGQFGDLVCPGSPDPETKEPIFLALDPVIAGQI